MRFLDLKQMGDGVPCAKKTYNLLNFLNLNSVNSEIEEFITELSNIQFGLSTNSFFYSCFPIVSHILYYKPQFEKR